jgi:hypothetical protein
MCGRRSRKRHHFPVIVQQLPERFSLLKSPCTETSDHLASTFGYTRRDYTGSIWMTSSLKWGTAFSTRLRTCSLIW